MKALGGFKIVGLYERMKAKILKAFENFKSFKFISKSFSRASKASAYNDFVNYKLLGKL